jgi:N-acetylglucosaminyldiphosphoundecaprenol N-acetyl-beta-D-mannosaminyltransferase
VELDLVRPEEVMHHITARVASGDRFCIANYNTHGVYLAHRHPDFGAFCQSADLIEVDSTLIIFFTRLLGLHSRTFHRCTYLDWRKHFWSVANREGWRVFYLGGAPGVADEAARKLGAEYPGATIVTHHGYFDATPGSAEDAAVLAQIAAFRPQILFVGMGMPRQESWLLNHADVLPPCVTLSVGAAFDYEAGAQRPAPRWMGRWGLEWAFRFVHEPRRLFARYFLEPWYLAPIAARDIFSAIRERRLLRAPKRRAPGSPTSDAPRAEHPQATAKSRS